AILSPGHPEDNIASATLSDALQRNLSDCKPVSAECQVRENSNGCGRKRSLEEACKTRTGHSIKEWLLLIRRRDCSGGRSVRTLSVSKAAQARERKETIILSHIFLDLLHYNFSAERKLESTNMFCWSDLRISVILLQFCSKS